MGALGRGVGAWTLSRGVAPQKWVAICTLLVGILAIISWWSRLWLADSIGAGWPSWLSDLFLALVVVMAPAMAAAAAFPALASLCIRDVADRSRGGALLAAVDLGGATAGLILGGIVLPQLWGYALSYGILIGVLLLTAGLVWKWSQRCQCPAMYWCIIL